MRLTDYDGYVIDVDGKHIISKPSLWNMSCPPQREHLADVLAKTYWFSQGKAGIHAHLVCWYLVVFNFDYVETFERLLVSGNGLSMLSSSEQKHMFDMFNRANAPYHKKNGPSLEKFSALLKRDHITQFGEETEQFLFERAHKVEREYGSKDGVREYIRDIKKAQEKYTSIGRLVVDYYNARKAYQYMYERFIKLKPLKIEIANLYKLAGEYESVIKKFQALRQQKQFWLPLSELPSK